MTKKNIFVWKIFFVIKYLRLVFFFFCNNCKPSTEKSYPLPSFPATPLSKLRSCQAPPPPRFFWKFGWWFNPPAEKGGGCTLCMYIYFNYYFVAPQPTLGHCQKGNLTNPMLITVFWSWFNMKATWSLEMIFEKNIFWSPCSRACHFWTASSSLIRFSANVLDTYKKLS